MVHCPTMRAFIVGGITVPNGDPSAEPQRASLLRTCRSLGQRLCEAGHVPVVCSPFEHSADFEILSGVSEHVATTENVRVDLHYPDAPPVAKAVRAWKDRLQPATLNLFPHAPLDVAAQDGHSFSYAWLLAQLEALEQSSVVFAIGGREDRTAGVLLRLAESRSKPVLPLAFLGGAAEASFLRRRYQLQDALGEEAVEQLLREPDVLMLIKYADILTQPRRSNGSATQAQRRFFISYARARPAEADHIEMILRRRNQIVLRDEQDIGPGHEIPQRLNEFLCSASVLIAVWCKEYACSPWCYDELELALDRHARGTMELWIFCVDDTRIVPRAARNLNFYAVRDREDLEGKLARLLDRS